MIPDDQSKGYRNGYDPDTFDVVKSFRRVLEAPRHHWGVVLFTCVLTLGLVTWYVYAWPPIYRAEAAIMAEAETDIARDGFYVDWNIFRKDNPRAEIELMTSGAVLSEVIEKEKLTYDDVYHPLLSQVSYFWQKSWPGRMYRATKKRLFPDNDPSAPSEESIEFGKTMSDLHDAISIQPVGDTNIGKVTVLGPSRRVAEITNTLLDTYQANRIDRHSIEAEKAYASLTEEANRAEEELDGATERRLAFTQEHGLIFDFQKESKDLEKLTDLEADITSSRKTVASLGASLQEVEKQLEKEFPTLTVSTVIELNSVRETAKLKRLELQTALIQVQNHYREDSPEVQEIKSNLTELDTLIAREPEQIERGVTQGLNLVRQQLITKRNESQSDLEAARASLAVLEEAAANLRNRLVSVPAMQKQLVMIDRDVQMAKTKHDALQLKQSQAAVAMTTTRATMPSLRILGYAQPPAARWWPRLKILYPAGLVVGLMLGVVAALIMSSVSGRVRKEHVEHGHGTIPLYATLHVTSRSRPLTVSPGDRPFVTSSSSGGSEN